MILAVMSGLPLSVIGLAARALCDKQKPMEGHTVMPRDSGYFRKQDLLLWGPGRRSNSHL